MELAIVLLLVLVVMLSMRLSRLKDSIERLERALGADVSATTDLAKRVNRLIRWVRKPQPDNLDANDWRDR